jgi:hypothetical protein
VYATTVGWSLASYVIFAAAVLLIKLSSRIALAAAAALAGGLYYWYAGPSIATNLGTSSALGTAVQVAGIGLVAIWLIKSTLLHEIDRRSQGRELSG